MRAVPGETTSSVRDAPVQERNLAIDRLRGALVILMVAGDYLGGVHLVPSFLKHAPDIGFTIADAVAPCFIFAIGLNYGPSFARRAQQNMPSAYRHFFLRYLALIGIGAILAAGGTAVAGSPAGWGVLQAIGLAGLICLAVIRLPMSARFAIGLLILFGYQYLLDEWALSSVLHSAQGGFLGAISWGALLILSTAVADVWRKGLGPYLICCAVLAVAAVLSALLVPVSKNRVSLSYVLIALAISAVAYLLTELVSRIVTKSAGFLCWWGENALVLYLVHLLILGLLVLPRAGWWYADAPIWLAGLQLAVLLTATSLLAWWMHRRKVRVLL